MALVRRVFTIGAIARGVYYTVRSDGALESTETTSRHGRNDAPVSVIAKTAEIADVPVYLEGVGSIKALNTATIRAQVDGRLLSVNFKEGENVKKGDLLAKIDPATYWSRSTTA